MGAGNNSSYRFQKDRTLNDQERINYLQNELNQTKARADFLNKANERLAIKIAQRDRIISAQAQQLQTETHKTTQEYFLIPTDNERLNDYHENPST